MWKSSIGPTYCIPQTPNLTSSLSSSADLHLHVSPEFPSLHPTPRPVGPIGADLPGAEAAAGGRAREGMDDLVGVLSWVLLAQRRGGTALGPDGKVVGGGLEFGPQKEEQLHPPLASVHVWFGQFASYCPFCSREAVGGQES